MDSKIICINDICYEKIKFLGRGCSGKVYLISNIDNDKNYALKISNRSEDMNDIYFLEGEIEFNKKVW
jgi:hypothetical protein